MGYFTLTSTFLTMLKVVIPLNYYNSSRCKHIAVCLYLYIFMNLLTCFINIQTSLVIAIDHLSVVVFVRFLHYKLTLFLFFYTVLF